MPFDFRKELKNVDEESAAKLIELYEQAENIIRKRVQEAISKNLTAPSVTATLKSVNGVVNAVLERTQPYVEETVKQSYLLGVTQADDIIDGDATPTNFESLSTAQLDQVKAIMSDHYLNFAETMKGVYRSSNRILSQALREQIRQKIALGSVTGEAIETIKRDLVNEFMSNGITAFVTRNGSNMSLATYARTLTRSMVIQSANDGIMTRAGELGLTVFQVSEHAGGANDDACRTHQGKIYDMTGQLYPKPEPDDLPPYHPNCRHILNPRPDLQFAG